MRPGYLMQDLQCEEDRSWTERGLSFIEENAKVIYSVDRDKILKRLDEIQISPDGQLKETLCLFEEGMDIGETVFSSDGKYRNWLYKEFKDTGFDDLEEANMLGIYGDAEFFINKFGKKDSKFDIVSFNCFWQPIYSVDWESGVEELDYFEYMGKAKVILGE